MTALLEEGFSFSGYERDLLSLNLGDGTFLDISGCSGIDSLSDGRGSVYGDFDNDGDLDLYVANDYGRNNLYRNDQGHFSDVAAEYLSLIHI